MSYPPPPPPPGSSDDPTRAFPPAGPPSGYPPQPGYAPPPPGAFPPGGYPPGGGGSYTPGPPSKKGMSTGAILGIAGVVLAALLAAGIGIFIVTRDGDDEKASGRTTTTSTTTTEDQPVSTPTTDDTTTSTTEDTTTSTTEESTTTTTTTGGSGGFSIDGSTTSGGSLDESGTANFHDVVVPDGTIVIVTITPDSPDLDLVAEADGQSFDDNLSGEPELIRVTGPDDFSLEVSDFGSTAGSYTVTIAEE